MLKVFIGSYWETWNYGGWAEEVCTVVANTENEALGLLLEEYPNLKTSCWYVTEVDLGEVGINNLHSGGS